MQAIASLARFHNNGDKFYCVFHGRVELFFANNSLTQFRITIEFLRNFI